MRLGARKRAPTKGAKSEAVKRVSGGAGDGDGQAAVGDASGQGPAVAGGVQPVGNRRRPRQWTVRQRRSTSPTEVVPHAPYHVRDHWSPEVSDDGSGAYGHSASTIEKFD